MGWSGLGCVESCKLEDTGHGYVWLFLCMCWIHHAITCRAKNLIFGRKWSTCFEFWSFNLCLFVFVPWRPWVLWKCAAKEHNNTSTGLLSLRAVAHTGGPDLPGWNWSWSLIYIIIIFDTNQEICPWKKKLYKKLITGLIDRYVDLPGWGWSWVLIYTSPTSSHLLHSQQKQKVNNFLVKTKSSWLPAGEGREIMKLVEPGLLVSFHSIANIK